MIIVPCRRQRPGARSRHCLRWVEIAYALTIKMEYRELAPGFAVDRGSAGRSVPVRMPYCLVNKARPLNPRKKVHEALHFDYLRKYR